MDALLAAADADSGGDDSYDEAEVGQEVGDEALLSTADSALSAANELEVDDNALECRITEFFPRKEKMCYKITGCTTLLSFQRREFTAIRKYEDFLWLHERLTENKELAGVLIPHLPDKVTWVSPEIHQIAQKVTYDSGLNVKLTDQFQKRALQLHRFLKRVCRHKLLREDIHVVVFLEFDEEIKPINDKSWFGTPIWFWDYIGTDRNEESRLIREWVRTYRGQLGTILPLAKTKSTASRELAVAETEMMMHFREEWDDQGAPMMAVFRHFSSGLIRSQINHHLRAQIEEAVEDLLEDCDGTAKVTGEMLDRSAALFGQADEALRVHNRARKDVASHEAYGSLETARGLAAQGKAKKAGGVHSELLANCQQAETSMAQELTLAGKRRTADFKDLFVTLAQHEVHQAQNRIATWQEFLDEIKRVELPARPASMDHAVDDSADAGGPEAEHGSTEIGDAAEDEAVADEAVAELEEEGPDLLALAMALED